MAARRTAPCAALALLAAAAATAAGEPDALVVVLRPQAAAGPHAVRVGDVADLAGGTAALREAVAALDLADAAAARAGVTVTARQVAFRVRLAGVPAGLFRVQGAAEARVEPGHCVVPEADVVAAAKEAVLKRLPWGEADVTVQALQPVAASLAVAAPREDVQVKAVPHGGAMPLGRVQVDVTLWSGGERLQALPVYLDVRLCQQVAVCLRKVERGEPLTGENVTFDRRPVDGLRDFLSSPAALAGKRARQPLLPGRVLSAGDVEDDPKEAAAPLVRKGEAVKLVVRLGPVNVTAAGEALQDGRAGQPVRVRNVDSKQVVLGRVAERNVVEVDP